MYRFNWIFIAISCLFLRVHLSNSQEEDCLVEGILSKEKLVSLSNRIIPDSYGSTKGDSGIIGVIGGSVEYTGAPYFSGYTALRVGADLVFVITKEQAASTVRSYNPDLIVLPYLNRKYATKLNELLQRINVVVIGPGAGRDEQDVKLILDIIETCKSLKKPIIIDADALFALSKNISILNNYPAPGVILTPNVKERSYLNTAINNNTNGQWHQYWGDNVSVLSKGQEDICYCSITKFSWSLVGGGSSRRASGQGDILAGALGTFYHWALKANLCKGELSTQLAKSVAIYAASTLTRNLNLKAFMENGRNMIASDMLKQIPSAFNDVFN